MKKLFIMLLCFICLVGCSENNDSKDELINYVEAKEQIINNGAILVDVRTVEEYNENHIDGAVSLPLETINEETVADIVDSKEAAIIVYCKSGNRSHQAYQQLSELGYSKVYDLGAKSNWEE